MSRPTLRVARAEDIGPALLDLRLSQGLIQRDIASASGIDTAHIGSYENNRVSPTVKQLLRLLAAHNYVIELVPREKGL